MTTQPFIADADRIATYTPSNSTGPFVVPFPLFDNTGADLVVYLDDVVQVNGWTLTADPAPGFWGAPNTWVNGKVTFAAPISGELVIEGRRAPRRTSQYAEGRGVPARDLNTELNILSAVDREQNRRLNRLEAADRAFDGRIDVLEDLTSEHTGQLNTLESEYQNAIYRITVLEQGGPVSPANLRVFVATAAPYNVPVYGDRTAALAGQDASAKIRQAVLDAHNAGGGIVYLPRGHYKADRSYALDGVSNVTLAGGGIDVTYIHATASLNGDWEGGTDNLFKKRNDVIQALNFSGSAGSTGYPYQNIVVQDLTINATLQNKGGIPVGQSLGCSLAGIEIMNVDHAKIRRVKFIKCFGNGAVIATQDPRLWNGATLNGVVGAEISDCVFEDCLRGLLPQYDSPDQPGGITGSVIQIGSAFGGRVANNTCLRPGGPFMDFFHCQFVTVDSNVIRGAGITPIGSNPTPSGVIKQQTCGTIRSDFGLLDCTIINNKFYETGGIHLLGNMNPTFFNGNLRTEGPQRCVVANNQIINPAQGVQIAPPALPASGTAFVNSNSQPLRVVLIGGTGISVTVSRGNDGTFTSRPLGPSGSFILAAGDAAKITYTTAPAWAWYLAHNAYAAGIMLMGGSVSGFPGQARDNLIRGNAIVASGAAAMFLIDASFNHIVGNTVRDPGWQAGTYVAWQLSTTFNEGGTGSNMNLIEGNRVFDTRAPKWLTYNYADDMVSGVPRCLDNVVRNNRLETATSAPFLFNSLQNRQSDNFGPGAPTTFDGAGQIAPIGSGAELSPPAVGDWMVTVGGGTVTQIALGKPGTTVNTFLTAGTFQISSGEVLKITYSVAPAVVWKRAR